MEELKKEIVSRIRSCLISTKGQITLRQLEDDYRTLLGERIPFQRLGHKNLESFVLSIPTIYTSRGQNGELFVDAQISEKSAHISTMVQKQKNSAPKKKVRIAHPPRYNHSHHNGQTRQPPASIAKWRPKRNPFVGAAPKRATHEVAPRLAAVSHNQFVSGAGYRKPKVPSKVVVVHRGEEVNNLKKSPPPPQPAESRNPASEKMVSESNGTTNGDECSPLSSTMKRITRIMSEISVDRDSGNSSPTMEFASKLQEFTKTGDPINDLRNFAAYHKLGDVEVKFTETKSKKSKIAQCHCKITVGQHKYSSYPEDFIDRAAAERHASQKALEDLMLKYSRRKSLLISSNDDIIERIPPMLEKHSNAVWMWQIEADYIDKYKEQLPSDWLQIIDNSSHVSIEKCLGGYVLKHCNPDDALQKGKKIDISLNVGDVSVPCNTANFGDNNRLYALIIVAHSVNEIWCHQCGTPEYDRFLGMSESMEAFYSDNSKEMVAANINTGSCYVVNNDGTWMRMRALSAPEDGVVHSFLLDYGEEMDVPVENVYILRREYALEQAQAFVCKLDGLEDLFEVSVESPHIQGLIGKEYVLEIVEESGDDDITIPVVIYDVTTGASINEDWISVLTIDSAVPTIDKNTITEVYVTNIESNGDVYVQVRTFGYYRLMEILNNLSDSVTTNLSMNLKVTPTRNSSRDKLYLVKRAVSQKWARATIIDWAPQGDLAQIYFVDYGNAQVIDVNKEKIFFLEVFQEGLTQYPYQAVKVRIMLEKIPLDFLERASKLLPEDQPVLLKISSYDNEKVAWVEFFKRTNDGVLVFINKSIAVEAELQSFDVGNNTNNNEITRKRLNNLVQFGDSTKPVPSGGFLKKPDLPRVGGYFNVNIPFSVNPWNFFVQPLDSFDRLTSLMSEMQEYYKDVQFSPLQIEDIVPGKIYVSKHEDGLWYRTSVLKVIHSGSISVYYCDFGYYTSLTLAQLVPIDAKYMSFPYQALKAKISGIRPVKNKWTMEDCDLFNSLVTKKQFVSILVNMEKDELYKSDIILHLLLIDTSSDEDINIKELLIEKGIAARV